MSKRDEAEAAERARAIAEMEDRARLAKGRGEMEVMRNRTIEANKRYPKREMSWREKQGLDP